ncbi:hypothetical protein O181_113366 [Austropuccinia psidii MF-1]|uniref:Uncharacterized protein n=1 Tax=Austropuccinia psidii MF-1 TaxID=1389203 RepID=A0A9Q3PUD4_9BASI|nr:hypothetical protein [Austropuccinia psidii MF-1]
MGHFTNPVDGNHELLPFNKGALGSREDHGTGRNLVPSEGQINSLTNNKLDEKIRCVAIRPENIPDQPFTKSNRASKSLRKQRSISNGASSTK